MRSDPSTLQIECIKRIATMRLSEKPYLDRLVTILSSRVLDRGHDLDLDHNLDLDLDHNLDLDSGHDKAESSLDLQCRSGMVTMDRRGHGRSCRAAARPRPRKHA